MPRPIVNTPTHSRLTRARFVLLSSSIGKSIILERLKGGQHTHTHTHSHTHTHTQTHRCSQTQMLTDTQTETHRLWSGGHTTLRVYSNDVSY